ncbi:MAG: hypothetical protein IH609_01440 [Dehalococcoidia bacterium]|nr:hypothetical protein [Dehalococcoidia bacterium]
MSHLERLGDSISIRVPSDEDGFTGRECPAAECEGYFKVQFGTGLEGEGLPCHCPYCGHTADHNQFWTREQIEYAKSVAFREITDAFHKDLKGLEFDHRPSGGFGIGISLTVQPGTPTPIRHYREKQLETEVVCVACSLRYAVYGVFAFCPDCGQHNSLQIPPKNLELARKMLDMAASVDAELGRHLVDNALEDCVSAFDGFGREVCRIHADTATNAAAVKRLAFQNLSGARDRVVELFGVDISAALTSEEWQATVRGFHKRHVLAHKMGVVDEEYVQRSGDVEAVVGRKLTVRSDEVVLLLGSLDTLGRYLHSGLRAQAAEGVSDD